jgi:hypothetical protein
MGARALNGLCIRRFKYITEVIDTNITHTASSAWNRSSILRVLCNSSPSQHISRNLERLSLDCTTALGWISSVLEHARHSFSITPRQRSIENSKGGQKKLKAMIPSETIFFYDVAFSMVEGGVTRHSSLKLKEIKCDKFNLEMLAPGNHGSSLGICF